MSAKSVTIKNTIKEALQDLQGEQVIADIVIDDLKKGILERDFAKYPVVVLTPPSISNDIFTNTQNIRTYIFELIVISKGDDVQSAEQIETLAEAIIDKFDNNPTLSGVADGGLEPSSTPAEPVTSRGGTLIVFSVILKAKAVKDITL